MNQKQNKNYWKEFWTDDEYKKLKKYFIKHLSSGEKVGNTIVNYAKSKNLAVHQIRCAWYKIKAKEGIEINVNDKEIDIFPITEENKVQIISDEEHIKEILDYYRKHVTKYTQPNEEKGIYEQYYFLRSRNVDAVQYLYDAIDIFARKDSDIKRNFGYLVNILRSWVIHGKGFMPTKEDSILSDIFEKALNIKLSIAAKNKLVSLMATYGLIELTFVLGKELLNIQDCDISLLYVKRFESILEKLHE